jgi:hypothetical protein
MSRMHQLAGRPPRPASHAGAGSSGSHRPLRPGHIRGVTAGPAAAGDTVRAAPARHRAGDSSWLDITIGGRVERHEGSWHRAGFDTQAITRGLPRSPQRHAALCLGRSRYVPPVTAVLKQALRHLRDRGPGHRGREGPPVRNASPGATLGDQHATELAFAADAAAPGRRRAPVRNGRLTLAVKIEESLEHGHSSG